MCPYHYIEAIPIYFRLGVDTQLRFRFTSKDFKSEYETIAAAGPTAGFSTRDWNDLNKEGDYYSEANLHAYEGHL